MELDTLEPSSQLVLPFDSRYLSWFGRSATFMNATEIMEWVKSATPYMQTWYDRCLVQPGAEHHLNTIRAGLDTFVKEMMQDCNEAHDAARMDGHQDICPSHHLFRVKPGAFSEFKGYIAATACFIATFGKRHGAFKSCEDEGQLHLAAVMLLISVIVDLKEGEYFATLFKKTTIDDPLSELERKLHELKMDTCNAPTTTEKDAEIEAIQQKIEDMKLSY